MILDTHQHFWRKDRGDYHWMTSDVPVLYRDYLPDDLRPNLRKAGVSRTVLVQAAETSSIQTAPAKTLPDDSHFKSGEPVEADSFYQLQKEMEPNGISGGPASGCPFDEEAIGQPLLG